MDTPTGRTGGRAVAADTAAPARIRDHRSGGHGSTSARTTPSPAPPNNSGTTFAETPPPERIVDRIRTGGADLVCTAGPHQLHSLRRSQHRWAKSPLQTTKGSMGVNVSEPELNPSHMVVLRTELVLL
jgi:hypothetical protein